MRVLIPFFLRHFHFLYTLLPKAKNKANRVFMASFSRWCYRGRVKLPSGSLEYPWKCPTYIVKPCQICILGRRDVRVPGLSHTLPLRRAQQHPGCIQRQVSGKSTNKSSMLPGFVLRSFWMQITLSGGTNVRIPGAVYFIHRLIVFL